MKYSESNPPLQCFMRQSTCYCGTRVMEVKGVLWHSTGANNPYLKRYVQPDDNASDRAVWLERLGVNKNGNDWNHITRQAGLNCWIGKLADGTVTTVQTMPWNYRPWGCGAGKKGSCNNGWIQFEICEDGLEDKAYFEAVYEEACEITAYLCQKYDLYPWGYAEVGATIAPAILCHWDSYELGLGSGHSDVYHWFDRYGKNMDSVRDDVATLMKSGHLFAAPIVDYNAVVSSPDGELNCREHARTESKIVKVYHNGDVVHITQEVAGWGWTGEGYVYLKYVVEQGKDEVDMTRDEVAALVEQCVKDTVKAAVAGEVDGLEVDVKRMVELVEEKCEPTVYHTLVDVPEWYKDTVHKLMNRGVLRGTGEPGVIDVSDDMCRVLTILDRMGKLD